MQYKTLLVLLIFTFSFTLIWIFHILISYIFPSIVISPYAVVGGLIDAFGPDLAWWATLGLILACLGVVEVSVATIRQRICGRPTSGDGAQGKPSKMSSRVWKEFEKDSHLKKQLQDLYQDES